MSRGGRERSLPAPSRSAPPAGPRSSVGTGCYPSFSSGIASPGEDRIHLLGNAINALVIGAVGLALASLGRGQFRALTARFEAVDRRFEGIETRIDRLEERFEARMDAFQSSLDGMRSDLTRVALAVGAGPQAAER